MVKKTPATPKAPTTKTPKTLPITKGTKPAVTKPTRTAETTESKQILDLCLLMDCTSSMQVWIERSKDTLKEIINNVKKYNPELEVRVCFVGYRDIKDDVRFAVHDFTDNIDDVKAFISK
jgi:hypothetical protein